ncbi:MAG: dihydropteroate synthase [Bacteroidales bacterium]|nr:dihydropteroate synthase [Bacteroidales bacterium]MDD2576427.1 dihydropteroate synthase [Bacteroidales bacterium]
MNDKITKLSYSGTINLQGKLISLQKPLIMGILNLTNDSFFDGGKYINNVEKAVNHAKEMIDDGADIIDIGACSTRPGANLVSKEEELKQLIPVIKKIRKKFPDIIISIDTVWADVAKETINEGANIINDISAGQFDDQLFKVMGEIKAPYVLTHTPSTPDKMQERTHYDNIFLDISKYFAEKIEELRNLGVVDIILDLGFGFGKTVEQNYFLLNHIEDFKTFGLPILTGISRKTMIHKPLAITPQQALNGTTFLHAFALINKSNILRVHDVREAKECVKLFELIENNK